MTARDLTLRRSTDERGNTTWQPSPLIQARARRSGLPRADRASVDRGALQGQEDRSQKRHPTWMVTSSGLGHCDALSAHRVDLKRIVADTNHTATRHGAGLGVYEKSNSKL